MSWASADAEPGADAEPLDALAAPWSDPAPSAAEAVVIGSAATGMTGPDELPDLRRALERATRELTEAVCARADAEEAALRASLEREAAEARARAQAEAAAQAQAERSAAEARARELTGALEETRAALLEQTRVTTEPTAPEPTAPEPAITEPTITEPTITEPTNTEPTTAEVATAPVRIEPSGVPELVELDSPGSSALVTVLVGLGALGAAGVAVHQAYLDRLTSTPGLVASAVTLALAAVVGRARGPAGRVWLVEGVLHIAQGGTHHRFDLTSPSTEVEMVGRPDERRWKVVFVRKGTAPYEVDAGLVDPEPFVAALRAYRPDL